MKRIVTMLLAALMLLATVPGPAFGDETLASGVTFDVAPIVQESDFDGNPVEDGPRLGRSILRRAPDRLDAVAQMAGLRPGGVYSFWWIVVQDDGTFPDDIFAATGAGAIADDNGRASIRMSASLGQPGITGFMPDGVNEIQFASLEEPLTATVRVEVAYHGQVEDAGDDLPTWLEDFWTGTACPPYTPNPNPAQPHCPVYYASTHS